MFPQTTLRFTNDFALFRDEVARAFPAERDNFDRLVANIADYDDLDLERADLSARGLVNEFIRDPLLVEMLFCPLMYYGSARERDMDYAQFCIMFRSIFMEGFARPFAGVRLILRQLVRKFRQLGGELRLRAGVKHLHVEGDEVRGVVLDDGTELVGRRVLSSAGWIETMRLCDDVSTCERRAGQLSFVETISVLNTPPNKMGFDNTIVFFNDSDKFHWHKAHDLVDVRSAVITSPNNFAYDQPLDNNLLRITALANYDLWHELPEAEYRRQKLVWYDRVVASACRFIPDFRHAVIDTDMFTPTTVRRYTGHENGAIYGSPEKQWDGTTHLKNLFVCGTDQGLVGIVGAIVSGISMANRHLLKTTV